MLKKCAIYTRTSTDKQHNENQLNKLREIAESKGYSIVKVLEDKGISGSKGRDIRTGFFIQKVFINWLQKEKLFTLIPIKLKTKL